MKTSTKLEAEQNVQKNSFKNYLDSLKQFIAGGVGGIFLVLAGHPMDTIKVRLQTMPTPKPGQEPQYKGMLDCMKKTIQHDGFKGFYRGMTGPIIAATPINAVCFFGFGLGVSIQTGGSPTAVEQLGPRQTFYAGMLTGAFTAMINAPIERIKCLMQVEQVPNAIKYNGYWDCAKKVYAIHGIRSIYTGLSATLAREIPGSGAYFMTYQYIKQNNTSLFTANQNQTFITFMAGGIAGIAFWIVAIPADVIKSRIQTAPEGKYQGFFDAIRYLYQRNGLTAFYKGATPTFIRAFPANAACFFGYEYSFKLLNLLIK